MAINFITSQPGEGKTYLAVWTICKRLVETEDEIHTNIRLDLGAVWEYCKQKWKKEIDIDRIKVFDDEQVLEFYRYLSDGFVAPRNEADGIPIDYDHCVAGEHGRDDDHIYRQVKSYGELRPVLVVIDEASSYWPSADQSKLKQSKMGKELAHWQQYNRKLQMDCYFVTQELTLIAAFLRKLAKFEIVCRNLGTETFMKVKMPQVMQYHKFVLTSDGVRHKKPENTKRMRLDREGIGRCYDTMAGVGMAGGGVADADRDTREGISWKMALPVAFGLMLLVVFGLGWGIPKSAEAATRAVLKKSGPQMSANEVQTNAIAARAPQVPAPPPVNRPAPRPRVQRPAYQMASTAPRGGLGYMLERQNFGRSASVAKFISGFTRIQHLDGTITARVYLHDGVKAESYQYSPESNPRRHDWEFQAVGDDYVIVKDELYQFETTGNVWLPPTMNPEFNQMRERMMDVGEKSKQAYRLVNTAKQLVANQKVKTTE